MFKQLCQLYSLSLFSECGLGIGLFVREKKKKKKISRKIFQSIVYSDTYTLFPSFKW